MGVHPNIHIPKESWPSWTWYAIECIIVIAVTLWYYQVQITNSIEGLSPEVQNYMFIGLYRNFLFSFGMLELDVLF